MNQLFAGLFEHSTSQACVADLTPPTFAGVVSATPNSDGSFTIAYAAATDATPPFTYEIYILPGAVSAATLFAASPCDNPRVISRRVYLDSNGNPMIKDQAYTIGVRVRDAVNNLNTNTATISATAIGSVNLAQVYQDLQTDFANDHANFVADHAALVADDAAYDTNNTNLANEIVNLANQVSIINAASNSLILSNLKGAVDESGEISGVVSDTDTV